jgi:DNA-binding NarL/FixJ family response regulator
VTVRVLVADDQALVRAGFRMILDAQPDITVVGEAGDGYEAIRLSHEQAPDVLLMDIRMPALDGIAATRALTQDGTSSVRVVILTTYDLDEYVYEALKAGASGFLLKDVAPERLIDGVRAVVAGDALLAPSITRRLISEFVSNRPPSPSPSPNHLLADLTPREIDVLQLIASGRNNTEIAAQLHISENTVKTHVTHVLDKLRLRDRVQAVIFAYQTGIAAT